MPDTEDSATDAADALRPLENPFSAEEIERIAQEGRAARAQLQQKLEKLGVIPPRMWPRRRLKSPTTR